MKKYILLSLTVCVLFGLTSCLKDSCDSEQQFQEYAPIYKSLDEIRSSEINVLSSQALENPGKIYVRGNTLIISDREKGVHIIDNTDKSNPKFEAFLEIEGNIDVSMKGNFLFADSYLDVLIIDIEDPSNPTLVSRMEDVKENQFYLDPTEGKYVVGYEQTDNKVTVDCYHPEFNNDRFEKGGNIYIDDQFDVDTNDGRPTEGPVGPTGPEGATGDETTAGGDRDANGVAGSLSRFAVLGDYFYYIDNSSMHIYNIEDLSRPYFLNGFDVDWGIETLFPYKDKLFIGGQNGMFIYDNSNPANPVFQSEFTHARSCDPVYVQGNIAFVTLRDGNACFNGANQLDVIDITDIFEPRLLISYPMFNPRGLSVVDDILYLCDEKAGLKIFDKSDLYAIDQNFQSQYGGITAHDVIARSHDCLIVTGPTGIYQIDANDPKNPVLLSELTAQ